MPVGQVIRDYQEALALHNRHVTEEDAGLLIRDARQENLESSRSSCCRSVEGTVGTDELRAIFEAHQDDFEEGAKEKIIKWLRSGNPVMLPVEGDDLANPIGSGGKVLVKAIARQRTWTCDWFPTTERPNMPSANLFSNRGVCNLYDLATGRQSQKYELENHRTTGISWAGHCDKAARVCCLLPQPFMNVSYNGQVLEPHHMQGLLVMISDELAASEEPFLGARNNGNPGDDPSEPYPHILMPQLIKWAKEGNSYVLDIDNGLQVWNYAFDSTEIQEFDRPQDGMRKITGQNGGVVKYQMWHLAGKGYDAEIRNYKSWIEYDPDTGEKLASGWFGPSSDTKRNPDFAWKPVARGDLTKKSNWPRTCSYNPEIDPQLVYDLYMKSIGRG